MISTTTCYLLLPPGASITTSILWGTALEVTFFANWIVVICTMFWILSSTTFHRFFMRFNFGESPSLHLLDRQLSSNCYLNVIWMSLRWEWRKYKLDNTLIYNVNQNSCNPSTCKYDDYRRFIIVTKSVLWYNLSFEFFLYIQRHTYIKYKCLPTLKDDLSTYIIFF